MLASNTHLSHSANLLCFSLFVGLLVWFTETPSRKESSMFLAYSLFVYCVIVKPKKKKETLLVGFSWCDCFIAKWFAYLMEMGIKRPKRDNDYLGFVVCRLISCRKRLPRLSFHGGFCYCKSWNTWFYHGFKESWRNRLGFWNLFFILGSRFSFLGMESERHEESRKEDSNVGWFFMKIVNFFQLWGDSKLSTGSKAYWVHLACQTSHPRESSFLFWEMAWSYAMPSTRFTQEQFPRYYLPSNFRFMSVK